MLLSLAFVVGVASHSSWLTVIEILPIYPTSYTTLWNSNVIFILSHLSFFLFKRIGNSILKNKKQKSFSELKHQVIDTTFWKEKGCEVWESFLTELRVKGGKMFLSHMNPLVVRVKAGWIPFFMELSTYFICLCFLLGDHLLKRKSKHTQSFGKFRIDADTLNCTYIIY